MTTRIIDLGVREYREIYNKMRTINAVKERSGLSEQIWLLEHAPVYTLGLSGKTAHILNKNSIAIVTTDRGGQVTYHGPGQLVVYLMINLKKKSYGVRQLVSLIEQSVIDYLNALHIEADRKVGAPGVYINGEKIAALGIRIKNGWTYHGLALNVDMDLCPYDNINPCGYPKLKCTQLKEFIDDITISKVKKTYPAYLIDTLHLSV